MFKLRLLVAVVGTLGSATAFVSPSPSNTHPSSQIGGPKIFGTPTNANTLPKSSLLRTQESKLYASIVNENENDLLPSAFFLASAAALGKLFVEIQGSGLPATPGYWALLFTTIAVAYDNFIIGIGKPLFSDVNENEQKHGILKTLSFPRFTAHAVFVPFLYATVAEAGKEMGVEWLQGDMTQTLFLVAAAALGIISRVRFVNSPGIKVEDDFSDSPPDAWERNLVWFTYVDPDPLYVLPAILLSLFSIVAGVQSFMAGDHPGAAIWLAAAGGSALVGNSPSKEAYVTRFTGNLAEVVMLWCIYESLLLLPN